MHTHRRLRLSQPTVRVRRHHRGFHPCSSGGWQAWPGRTDPDLSLPSVPHDVHSPARHALVPFENAITTGRNGALCTGRRAGSFGGPTGLRLPAVADHYLAGQGWTALTDLARAVLPPSPAPTPPTGRTAHQAALRHAGAVALVGHRSSHQASSRALSRSPHATRGAQGHSFLAIPLGSWLHSALHQ